MMKTATKIWLAAAAGATLLGGLLFGGAMMATNGNFNALSTSRYETSTHTIEADFGSVEIDTKTANVTLLPSEGNACTVVCNEPENARHAVSVTDGTLVVELIDTRKWYERIGFHITAPTITIYLPKDAYDALSVQTSTGSTEIPRDFRFESVDVTASTGRVVLGASAGSVRIEATTGDIRVEQMTAASLDLSVSTGTVSLSDVACDGAVNINVSTGKAYLTNVTCSSLSSSGKTGDVSLKNVVAAETITIKRSTGDVTLDACDAAALSLQASTGNVRGSLLSEKVFIVETSTGKTNVPDTATGGRCEITTTTGSIHITLVP